ncbi:MAG: TonB-dependent receptor [Segetibacter sp.]|nr:TonB-dependent receptor [Segetibacter sp.]
MKRFLLIALTVVTFSSLHAQRKSEFDTTKKTVVITSAYKPVLKPAAKINFSAATAAPDTSKPYLTYKVPAQNLFFTYQPASLQPLALSMDSTFVWENSNFVKLGVGNYSTPFAQAGLSFGDGKTSLVNVNAKHISQKGSIPFQQYSRSTAEVLGVFSTGTNTEWSGKIGVDRNNQYYYGYRPDTLEYSKDSLRQRFNTLSGMIGLRNKEVNSYGISYAPTLSVNFFNDNRKGKEMNILLNAPLTKTFTGGIGMNVGFTADMTRYNTFHHRDAISNNLYYLSPAVTFKKSTFTLNAGITPSWDNNEFHLLPNFTGLIKVKDANFVLQAGWIGYYQKNTFQSLAAFNPWIAQPASLLNTRITEQFFGFKGSAGSHFTYNARVSNQSYKNVALFTNDFADGKTFVTIYDPTMKALKLQGEVGYTFQERFSLLGGASINRYTGLKDNSKAWGLLPLEVTGSLRWQVLKDLQFKSDLFFWDGPRYVTKELQTARLKGAFDLNAGVEFTVIPKLNLWLQFNNVLNNKYERWNQYQVLGFNVLGGIVYSFSKTTK